MSARPAIPLAVPAPRRLRERLAVALAAVAMAAVLGITLTPREAFGLLPLSAPQAELSDGSDGR